jgi:hypothetical protein
MNKIIEIRATFSFGCDKVEMDYDLHDDGTYISKPSSWPGGGTREIVGKSGDLDYAINVCKRSNFPFWIGGAGYSCVPISLDIKK